MASSSELWAKRMLHPEQWEADIRKALERHGGAVDKAAARLRVSPRHLYRWLHDPRFADLKREMSPSPPKARRSPSPDQLHAPKKCRPPTELGAARYVDPDWWETQIREAMQIHGGRVKDAAAHLEISSRQLWRWLRDPRLRDVERAKLGRPVNGKGEKHDH